MKQLLLIPAFWMMLSSLEAQSISAVGNWREHVPFSSFFHVVESKGVVYSASQFGFILYDPISKEIQRKTRMSGLNGSQIIKFAKFHERARFIAQLLNTIRSKADIINEVPE